MLQQLLPNVLIERSAKAAELYAKPEATYSNCTSRAELLSMVPMRSVACPRFVGVDRQSEYIRSDR
jgi:hypothetical protein